MILTPVSVSLAVSATGFALRVRLAAAFGIVLSNQGSVGGWFCARVQYGIPGRVVQLRELVRCWIRPVHDSTVQVGLCVLVWHSEREPLGKSLALRLGHFTARRAPLSANCTRESGGRVARGEGSSHRERQPFLV